MLKRHLACCFEAKLKSIGEDGYYTILFRIIPQQSGDNTRGKLWEYLNHPEQTGFRYEKCVALTFKNFEEVLVEEYH